MLSVIHNYAPVFQWLHTRVWITKIAALWGLLMLCSILVNVDVLSHITGLVLLATLLLLLIIGFRLWDDLADRAFDRHQHPERMLVNTDVETITVFYQFAGMLLALAVFLLVYNSGTSGVIGLLLLIVFIAGVYAVLSALTPYRTLRNNLILLKYPAILMLLAPKPMAPETALIAGLSYGLLVAYEYYDNYCKPH